MERSFHSKKAESKHVEKIRLQKYVTFSMVVTMIHVLKFCQWKIIFEK